MYVCLNTVVWNYALVERNGQLITMAYEFLKSPRCNY